MSLLVMLVDGLYNGLSMCLTLLVLRLDYSVRTRPIPWLLMPWLLVLPDRQQPRHWLFHWGRVTHICVGNLTIIGSDNGLAPSWHQAIIWTNTGILLTGPLGTNFTEILIEIITFSLKIFFWKCLVNGSHFVSASMCYIRQVAPGLTWGRILMTCAQRETSVKFKSSISILEMHFKMLFHLGLNVLIT